MATSDSASFIVLFVQGAWHTEPHAAPLIDSLKSSGYHCETAPYPTNILTMANPYTEPDHPDFTTPLPDSKVLPDAHDDAAAIRGKLEALIGNEQKKVLMLAHSYGGRAASEAADQKLSRVQRLKDGKKGGLLGIFYASAFSLPLGKSMLSFAEGTTFPGFKIHPSSVTTMDDPENLLFHELSPDKQQQWKSLLVPQSVYSGLVPLDYAGYVHVPCGYLLCENDRLVPIAMQERLVQGMKDAGAQVKTWRRPWGHELTMAHPDELKELLLEFGKECI